MEIDLDGLEKDFNWSVIKCIDWKARNKIVREIKPSEGILAIKNEDYDSNNIYIMSKITKDQLQTELEATFGKEEFQKLGTVYKMNRSDMAPHRIVQLLLNSMNKKSLFMETNAEGHFYMVLDRIHTKDVVEPFYGKVLVMEIKAVSVPECMSTFGDVMINYSVSTFNNTLRKALNFDVKKWKYTVFSLDDYGIHTGNRITEGNMFIHKAVYSEKAQLNHLCWQASKDEQKLNQSKSVLVLEVLKRLEKRYGKYLGQVTFAKCQGEIFDKDRKKFYHDRMIDHFKNRDVYIINRTGFEFKPNVDDFVQAIESSYNFKVKRTNVPALVGYNVPIIFDKEYYKENDQKDPHNEPTVGITQFALISTVNEVLDQFGKKAKSYQTKLNKYYEDKKKWESAKSNKGKEYNKSPPAPVKIPQVEAIFEQLFIKEDVGNDVVSYYHWAHEQYSGNWIFARPICHTDSRKTILDGFAYITIDPEGKIIEKEFFCPSDPFAPSKLSRIDWNNVTFAVINPQGDLNLVTKTDATTLADGLSIKELIQSNNQKIAEYEERTKDWTDEQKEADMSNKPQRAEGVGTWENKMKYMAGCIGVGYIKLSDKRWLFYVGSDNPNQVIANASSVYLIEAVDDSDIFFEELCPMMTVPFVKHEQNTVIPFPVKYLNEWYRTVDKTWKP